jgi:phosphoglycerate dehydrogenase-like enzyme
VSHRDNDMPVTKARFTLVTGSTQRDRKHEAGQAGVHDLFEAPPKGAPTLGEGMAMGLRKRPARRQNRSPPGGAYATVWSGYMQTLKVFCNVPMDATLTQRLQEGVAPHLILSPKQRAASVLAPAAADPTLAEADVAFGQPDVAGILNAPRLRWVQVSSAGYTRYDTSEFRRVAAARGLVVTNSSSVYAEPCAEHALAFMLAQARRLPEGMQSRCAHGSETWLRLRSTSALLRGQTVLLLGFGAIGRHLVELLRPLKMKIIAVRRRPRGNEGIETHPVGHLSQLLGQADHVVNILPDTAETARFFAAPQFAALKPGAVFYNIGRGVTVDQEALASALRAGSLAAAWLDVTDPEPLPSEHPLPALPNCFITPHTAGGHQTEFENLAHHFLENFRRFQSGDPLEDRVI